MKKKKKVHFIYMKHSVRENWDDYFTEDGFSSVAECTWQNVMPIEDLGNRHSGSLKGTFDPHKVTCKNCMKSVNYKNALDKVDNPLFYWRERCE